MLVKSHGALYIHFNNECLKHFDDEEVYTPEEKFNYSKIKVDVKAKGKLNDTEKAFLLSLGVQL